MLWDGYESCTCSFRVIAILVLSCHKNRYNYGKDPLRCDVSSSLSLFLSAVALAAVVKNNDVACLGYTDSYTGDVREHARTSVFAWEAAERGQEVHPVADPSQAEMLRKVHDQKKSTLKEVREGGGG